MSKFADVVRAASEGFNPFTPASGTEHVAPLLYSIIRMARPRTLVEYGSGYTTLFLLAACADNMADASEEGRLLRQKTNDITQTPEQWYAAGGKACGIDPAFYLSRHEPHLYCFEKQPDDSFYVDKLRALAGDLHVNDRLTYFTGARPSIEALPATALPIDLAWNDDDGYEDFFDTFWPHLNPSGGLIVFHNTVAGEASWNTMSAIRTRHRAAGDLEMLTLAEPHKLWQNACTVIRRVDGYRPSFHRQAKERVLTDLLTFMEASPYGR